jgi:hypothetical protein
MTLQNAEIFTVFFGAVFLEKIKAPAPNYFRGCKLKGSSLPPYQFVMFRTVSGHDAVLVSFQ